jgi:hypothetical protein
MNVFDVEAINAQIEANQKEIDDFAINFGGWFICHYIEEAFYNKEYIKKMLEIYKKEKGL